MILGMTLFLARHSPASLISRGLTRTIAGRRHPVGLHSVGHESSDITHKRLKDDRRRRRVAARGHRHGHRGGAAGGRTGSDVVVRLGQHGLRVVGRRVVGRGPVARARRQQPAQAALEEVGAVVERPARERRAPAARLEVPVAAAVQLLVGRHPEAHHLQPGARGQTRRGRAGRAGGGALTRYSWQQSSTVTQKRWKAALSATQATHALQRPHASASASGPSGGAAARHSARKYCKQPHSIQQHMLTRLARNPRKYRWFRAPGIDRPPARLFDKKSESLERVPGLIEMTGERASRLLVLYATDR